MPISVNFSTVQFNQKNLDQIVARTVQEAGIDPSLLTLEITESVFMNDLDSTCEFLQGMKKSGFSISVDDFGTGYSSLSYLRRLPVDTLKIDISFIRDLASDPNAASIVTAIIAMAHSLNLKTIAEGVETDEQWRILRLLRCDIAQGYFFSPPVPPDQVEAFFKPHEP